MKWLDHLLGLSIRAEDLSFAQMIARALLMYVALIAIVRFGKKRFLGQATAFDFILAIMAGSIAARAVTGGTPYFGSMLAIGTLVIAHWFFSYFARDSAKFSALIKGTPTRLIHNGTVDKDALRAAHMSDDDLEEDLRQQGVRFPREVAEARLERSGTVSVVKKA